MMGPEGVHPISRCWSRGTVALSYVLELNLEGNFPLLEVPRAFYFKYIAFWMPLVCDHDLTGFSEKMSYEFQIAVSFGT